MKISLDKADTAFSQYIRLRDKKCCRCGSKVEFNDKGLPITHQCSHFYGRRSESTRFEPDNADCLCWGCHQYWGSDNREEYRDFKLKQLGQKRFDTLRVQNNTYMKKDRKMRYIECKAWVDDILDK